MEVTEMRIRLQEVEEEREKLLHALPVGGSRAYTDAIASRVATEKLRRSKLLSELRS